MSLNRRRQTGATAANDDHVVGFWRSGIAALFRRQRFTGFHHRFGDRFFHRLALAGGPGNGVNMWCIRVENTGTNLFKAGDELNVLIDATGQLDIDNTVGFQAYVNDQFTGIILNGLHKHARLKFRHRHAHIADHRFHQREAPQRFRNVQRFTLGAVNKQIQRLAIRNTVRPVRISNAGTADGHQVVTVFHCALDVVVVYHAANAHDRYLRQRFRAHGHIFFNQRRRVIGLNDRRAQGRANGEVQVVQATCGQFFQQIHGVVEADPRDFHLFRREAIANNKGIIRILAHHFVGDLQHRQREFGAVVTAAAPLVVALVGVWGIELLNQIGISTVQFHTVETGLDSAAHRFTKFTHHAFHFCRGQRNRCRSAFARCGHGAWPDRCTPTDQLRINHTATVINLQQRFGTLGFDGFGNFRQPGNFIVAVDTQRPWESQA